MIRFYSLFVTDDDLLASPYIRRFNIFHDLTLHRGATETVNFLLQSPITKKQEEELSIIYDPHALQLQHVETKPFKHQTLVTVKLVPKELGSLRIGLAIPQTEPLHHSRLSRIHSPLTTVSSKKINEQTPA